MKNKGKKKIRIIMGIIFAVVFIKICRLRYLEVNKEYKDAPVIPYQIGEEVAFEKDILMDYTMEGYSITVKDAEVLTYQEFLKKYNAKDEYTYVPEKVYDVTVVLKNIDANNETGVNFMDFYVQGLAVVASMESNLYAQANPKLDGVYQVALKKNSEMEFHLPFALWKLWFNNKTWNHLEDFDMNFVATLYPAKKVVGLKTER